MKKRNNLMVKTLVTSTVLSLSLISLSGCTKESAAVTIDTDVAKDIVAHYNIKVNEAELSKYRDVLSDINDGKSFSEIGLTVAYNDNELIFPFNINVITVDGWTLSNRTYTSDIDKLNDYTDAAIYTSSKYGNSELVLSSYKVSGQSGVAGRQDILKEYGAYSMSLYYDTSSDIYPNLKICDVEVFNTPEDELIGVLNKSNSIRKSDYTMGDVTTYSYVYDLGSYLVELKVACKDGKVKQCSFTTTVSSVTT